MHFNSCVVPEIAGLGLGYGRGAPKWSPTAVFERMGEGVSILIPS